MHKIKKRTYLKISEYDPKNCKPAKPITVECLIFARTLLREFREAPWIRQNKTRQI